MKATHKPCTLPLRTALLVVDVINDLQFPGGEKILPWAQKMADHLVPLMKQARAARIPVIYANDNFGHWKANFKDVVSHCTRKQSPARVIVRRLLPETADYFVLKPKHSAFFATSLVPLLEYLQVKHLVLVGIATNLCVLFTAHDAHMHEYTITVASDCCAAESDHDHDWALQQLETFVRAKVCRGSEIRFRTSVRKTKHKQS